jgi:hypothetical protein
VHYFWLEPYDPWSKIVHYIGNEVLWTHVWRTRTLWSVRESNCSLFWWRQRGHCGLFQNTVLLFPTIAQLWTWQVWGSVLVWVHWFVLRKYRLVEEVLLVLRWKQSIGVWESVLHVQWGKKVFRQPPIVQVLPLKKMREACNFHHRYTSTRTDKIRKQKSRKSHCMIFYLFICKWWWKISIWSITKVSQYFVIYP